jgi:acetyl esterase
VRGLAALPHGVLRLLVGRPVVRDGQHLDVESQLGLKLLALARAPELAQSTVPEARARVATDAQTFKGPELDVAHVSDLVVPGPGGSFTTRLYVPSGASDSGPLLVYYHGGGFVVCDLDTHDNVSRFLARQAGVRVLSVDYRLAPEHRFPAAIDDALAAFRFAVEQAGELGADPARIAVGGDSAGGNLAAGVARLTSEEGGPAPAFQLLFYPWLDLAAERSSYELFGEGFYLTGSDLRWYRDHYLADQADAADPRCSPLAADRLDGVPPAYISVAGFDPLRDDGEAYAKRLRDAGVRVALRRHPGLIHGFANTVAIGHSAREAVLEAAGALRMALAG